MSRWFVQVLHILSACGSCNQTHVSIHGASTARQGINPHASQGVKSLVDTMKCQCVSDTFGVLDREAGNVRTHLNPFMTGFSCICALLRLGREPWIVLSTGYRHHAQFGAAPQLLKLIGNAVKNLRGS
eukprot:2650969-Rhodomonas_salina.1